MVRLVRPGNLSIIGFTMILFWFFLVHPLFLDNQITPILNSSLFTALMLMTMLVAAGGYVINDLQDVQTDAINKPESQIIHGKVSPKNARILYFILNIAALALAAIILFQTLSFNVMGLCAICILILWLYSKYFKSTIIMGNVVVSLLIGLIPFIFVIIEAEAFAKLFAINAKAYNQAYATILSFTIFAFLTNMIREVVKDCEDIKGDQGARILTLATGLGLKKADIFSKTLTILLFIAALIWIFLKGIYVNFIGFSIFIFIVIFPIIYLFWLLHNKERDKQKYTMISGHLKLLLVLGLVYLMIYLSSAYA